MMNVFKIVFMCALVVLCTNLAKAEIDPNYPDILLWVTADAGVMTTGDCADCNDVPASTGDVVSTWLDQTAKGHDAVANEGATMSLETANFGTPAADHPVIRFNGDGFFALDTAALRVPDLTIYAVAEMTGSGRRSYFSTYSNAAQWGYGYHVDMEGPYLRAFTSAGTSGTISDWIAGSVSSTGMILITTQIDSTGGTKTVYVNGGMTALGTTTMPAISFYEAAETASIGSLGQLGVFNFVGDIAEILVFASVDAQQRTDAETYFGEKYGLAPLCGDWGYLAGDINKDCYVTLEDFAVLTSQWLECTHPTGVGCSPL